MTVMLGELNRMGSADFAASIGDTFELAPWVAEAAAARRPFGTVTALHDAMMGALRAAPRERQLEFLRGHPDLAGKAARAGALTDEFKARAGQCRPRQPERGGVRALPSTERCLQGEVRLSLHDLRAPPQPRFDPGAVRAPAAATTRPPSSLPPCRKSSTSRGSGSRRKVTGEGMPAVNGRLSTHVLDTHAGRPAVGVAIELYEFAGENAHCIAIGYNECRRPHRQAADRRPSVADRPLRIALCVGNHFRSRGIESGDPPFLDIVPLRFSIAEPEGHYHVPLLCTPWSYSTYRGS